MKKRILSSLLCLCLMLSLSPMAALATADTADTGSLPEETEPIPSTEVDQASTYEDSTTVTRSILAELIYQNEHFKSVIGNNTADAGFGDISSLTQDQQNAINAMANAHFISGTGIDENNKLKFNPEGNVTRADAAVIFWKLTGSKQADTSSLTLTDVNATAWYAPAVAAMAAAGIISGTQDNKFNPEGTITVNQLNALITKCVQAVGNDGALAGRPAGGTRLELLMSAYEKYKDSPLATVTATEIAYADIGTCSTEQQAAIQFFTSRGVVSGYKPADNGVNLFGPYDAASNLQTAVFLYQCAKKFEPTKTDSQPEVRMALFSTLAEEPSNGLQIPEGAQATVNAAWAYLEQEIGTESIQSFKNSPNDAVSTSAVEGLVDALVPEAPTISVSDDGQVAITTAEEDAVIYYTTDGTAPTVNSTQYTADFALDEISTIKAVAVKNSLYSEIATYTKQEQPALTISPSATSLNGGGTITLTANKAVSAVTCSDNSIVVTESGGAWTATLPNATATYTFTATAGEETASCTVSVTYQGGGNTGSGSSGNSGNTGTVSGSGDNVSISVNSGSVSTSQLTQAVRKADSGSTIAIGAPSRSSVSLSSNGLQAAADNSNDVTIELKNAEVTLSPEALSAVAEQAGSTVTLAVAPVETAELNSRQQAAVGDAPVFDLTIKSGNKTISDFDGGLATISLPYELAEDQDPAGVVVWFMDDNGNISACETMYDLRTKCVIFTTRHFSMYVIGYVEPMNFTDVPENAYYYDAVAWAVQNGVTGGTSATTFSPDAICTRAEMVTFLWRAAGSPEPTTTNNPFTDVQSGEYYYDAVLWAVTNGITAGTSATTFSPDATCTRGQAMTFLWHQAGNPVVNYAMTFTDVATDAYYAEAVRWAVSEGVTVGTSGTTFSPDADCTRAQIVTFLYRGAN